PEFLPGTQHLIDLTLLFEPPAGDLIQHHRGRVQHAPPGAGGFLLVDQLAEQPVKIIGANSACLAELLPAATQLTQLLRRTFLQIHCFSASSLSRSCWTNSRTRPATVLL